MTDVQSVMVLIDGDNFDVVHAAELIRRASGLGTIEVQRVYCNARGQNRWESNAGFRIIHAGSGKNAADLLLTIDAMQFALKGDRRAFVLASGDSDFVHLALRLRELGHRVIWYGEAGKSSTALSELWCFESIEGNDVPGLSDEDICLKLRKVILCGSKGGKGVGLKELGTQMSQRHGITKSSVGIAAWRDFLASFPDKFIIDNGDGDGDGASGQAYVRCLKNGFASS